METKKILIVEDDTQIIKLLTSRLNRESFEVLQAINGEAGLKTALSEHPDLILLDIMMPKMDGLSVLKTLRKDDWGKNVPVFILTSYDSMENIAEGVKHHVNEFIVKSNWEIEDIINKVKKVLKIRLD